MVGVPINFQAISNVLASYNFVDIASGTGYISFYAGKTVDLRLLSNFSYYSDTMSDLQGTDSTNYALVLDHDYDVLLNRPLDLSGSGIVNIPICTYGSQSTAVNDTYVTVILRKWDGASETDIVTNDSRVLHSTSTSVTYTMLAVDLIIPLTHFKKGETLRLSINVYSKTNAGEWTTGGYAHDPKNRTTGWDTTGAVPSQLSFQCPVRLNL